MTDPSTSGAPRSGEGFTHDLRTIEAVAAQQPNQRLTIEALERLLEGRGFVSLILILSLPFVQPIPLPGLSLLFGMAITALGLRIALGRHAGLPQFLRRRELDSQTVEKLVQGAQRVFARLERLFRRRYAPLLSPPLLNLAGLSLMLCGLALAMPLPPVILFSNGLPAIAVILICLGILERDGLFVLLGHVTAVATWVYFGLWAELIRRTFEELPGYLTGLWERFF